jgi:hypothetical protein
MTPEQQRALDHAREVLAEDKAAVSFGGLSDAEWRRELRMALRDVIEAFPEGH